jgi:hypothetical protein
MRLSSGIGPVLLSLALLGCAKEARRAPAPAPLAAADLVTPAILGASLGQVRGAAGPPLSWSRGAMALRMDGCLLRIYPQAGRVAALGVTPEPGCRFNPAPFLGPEVRSLSSLTFGAFRSGLFYVHCQGRCRGGDETTILDQVALVPGRSDLGLTLVAKASDPDAAGAFERWRNAVRAGEGNIFWDETKLRCSTRYNNAAAAAFTDVHPAEIIFVKYASVLGGYALPADCADQT